MVAERMRDGASKMSAQSWGWYPAPVGSGVGFRVRYKCGDGGAARDCSRVHLPHQEAV